MIKQSLQVKKILHKIQKHYPDVSQGGYSNENNYLSFDSNSQLALRAQTANASQSIHPNPGSSMKPIRRTSITKQLAGSFTGQFANNKNQQSPNSVHKSNNASPPRKNKNSKGINSNTQINFINNQSANGATLVQTSRQQSQSYSKYIENLEKKLNELNGGKHDKKNLNSNYKQVDTFKTKSAQKKLKMCRQFLVTGLCKNGQNCHLAHNVSELNVQYIPKVWSEHFDQHKKSNQYLSELKNNFGDREIDEDEFGNEINHYQEDNTQNGDYNKSEQDEDAYQSSFKKEGQADTTLNKNQIEESFQKRKSFSNFNDQTSTQRILKSKQDISSLMKKNQSSINFQKPGSQFSTTLRSKKEIDTDNYIVDINKIINQRGRSILLEAVLQGCKEVVKELLLKGANPCITDWSGNDCVLYSIKKNSPDILRYLLDYSQFTIDLNKQFNTSKMTYLMYATQNGQTNIMIILLANGANPNITDQFNRTPLTFAVKNNDVETIQALCENGAFGTTVDDYNKTPVDYAFAKKQLEIVSYLFKKGGVFADQKKNRKVMFFAAENNLIDLINEMIQRNNPITDKDQHGNNLLMLLYKNRHFDNIMKVIDDLNLFAQICEKNHNGDSVLTLTAKEGNDYIASQLVIKYSTSININIQDKEGKSCLIHACEHGFDDLVELLLQKGADPNLYDRNWDTPLLLAVKNDHLMCVRALLQCTKGIDILWKDQYQNTARNCSKSKAIRNLISQFMVEHDKMSDSLIKELEDEEFNLQSYFDKNNNTTNSKKGSIVDGLNFSKKNFRIKKQTKI